MLKSISHFWFRDSCQANFKPWLDFARRYNSDCQLRRPILHLELLEEKVVPSTFIVSSLSDSGGGSLRAAIDFANITPGTDTITFNVTGTITPLSALPTIIDSVVIDGWETPATLGPPLIELDGTSAGGSANGLTITTSNSIVRGLAINRFDGAGVLISGNRAFNNQLVGNYLGTNLAGTVSAGNGGQGVWITNGANTNIVGTNGDSVNDVAERNIISGNSANGVFVDGTGTDYNVIAGNFIGTDAVGSSTVPNRGSGVRVSGVTNTRIGTDGNGVGDEDERNTIAGNSGNGIVIDGVGTTGTIVASNSIGASTSSQVERATPPLASAK